MNIIGLASPKSTNRKTGPMAAVYRPVGTTCPSTCPLLNNGCYAQRGPAALQSSRSSDKTFNFDDVISRMPRNVNTIRLNVTGDFLDERGNPDETYIQALKEAAKNNPDITFYGYTHAWRILKDHFKDTPSNVIILASVNSKEEAAEAKAEEWTYARVTKTYDREDAEVYCPIDKAKHAKRKLENFTCNDCKMCFDGKGRDIVFFKV